MPRSMARSRASATPRVGRHGRPAAAAAERPPRRGHLIRRHHPRVTRAPAARISRWNSSMPVSMRLGLRLRHTSTAVPSATQAEREQEEEDAAHRRSTARRRPRTRSLASRPHSEPPAQVSRFQIGTVAFSVSMQNRAASNASLAVGRRRSDHDRGLADRERPGAVQQGEPPGRASGAGPRRRSPRAGARPAPRRPRIRACRTASRPSAWSRAVPVNTTTAPQSGRTAQSFTTPADSTPSVSSSQVSLWLGGSSTRSC